MKTNEDYLEEECEEMAKRILGLCMNVTKLYFQKQRLLKENEALQAQLDNATKEIEKQKGRVEYFENAIRFDID